MKGKLSSKQKAVLRKQITQTKKRIKAAERMFNSGGMETKASFARRQKGWRLMQKEGKTLRRQLEILRR